MTSTHSEKVIPTPQIVCVGSALVDLLLNESDRYLEQIDGLKGSMTLVEHAFSTEALKATQNAPVVVPGGSACNTAVGVGRLGGAVRFVGKCGADEKGAFFEQDLRKQGVHPWLYKSQTPTGRCLSVVTPDAQRTMFTYLGASAELQTDEVSHDCFLGADIVHVEGYLVFNQDLISTILRTAKDAGAKISLDLASFNVVEADRPFLVKLVRDYVDILIANEDEAQAYTQSMDERRALERLAADAELAILKIGARGSRIQTNGTTLSIPAVTSGPITDTTGAGDLWAAGFLYGLANHKSIEIAGAMGSLLGVEVCQVMGANIPDSRWPLILQTIDRLQQPVD